MLEVLRKFLATGAGTTISISIVLIGLIMAFVSLRGLLSSEGEALSANRMFVDSTTGKPFALELKMGMSLPVRAPSGNNTGYPAEACYWTKDGQAKKEPTYVLLNSSKTPGSREPTFCPDCGRLVVGHNPAPSPDMKPPPTNAEYKPRNSGLEAR